MDIWEALPKKSMFSPLIPSVNGDWDDASDPMILKAVALRCAKVPSVNVAMEIHTLASLELCVESDEEGIG